jgi:N-methylhydantoinase B
VTNADPISTAVVRASVVSVAREVFRVFKRTAMLPIIYEVNDFSVSIYDDRLNLIGDAPGLPEFVGTLDFALEGIVREFADEDVLVEGDVVIANHPFFTGAHPADLAVVVPVFLGGRIIAFACIRAHMGDMGAKDTYPCDALSMYEEGLLLPPSKLYEAGTPNKLLQRIIGVNSRLPDETYGNLLAAGQALRGGATRLTAMAEKYGLDAYYAAIDQLLEQGEREVRAMVSQMRDGHYVHEEYLDDNGIDDEPVLMRCAVTIAGSDVTVDLSGSAAEQPGPLNATYPQTVASCRLALKRVTTQDSMPTNSGEHRPLTVTAPEGSMFNPRPPAATFLMGTTGGRLTEMLIHAMASAAPERLPVAITGAHIDSTTGRATFFGDSAPIGYGATASEDGMSALQHPCVAGMDLTPTEVWETRLAAIKLSNELLVDSGGPGRNRGGLGTRSEWEFFDDVVLSMFGDKARVSVPLGLEGGRSAGAVNGITINPGTPSETRVGKRSNIPLRRGDRVVMVGGGGGGFGDPLERDPLRVQQDVRDGFVSLESAERDYAVVLHGVPPTVDADATEKLRAERRDAVAGAGTAKRGEPNGQPSRGRKDRTAQG